MRKHLSGKRNCKYETQTERKHEIEDTYGKKGEVKCRVQEIRDIGLARSGDCEIEETTRNAVVGDNGVSL